MLKIKHLTLKNGFNGTEEEIKQGGANLSVGTAGAAGTLGGGYHIETSADGVVAGVTVAGTLTSVPFAPAALKLVLDSKVVRTFSVEAGSTPLPTGMELVNGRTATILPSSTATATGGATSDNNVTLNVTKAGLIDLELDVLVAEGLGESEYASDVTPEAGECHVDALCIISTAEGRKPMETSWTVRGAQLEA